jgi:ammonium transporter, Amt family
MGNNLDALTTVFTEFYYWVTVVIMFLIHVGFCMYEVGASRRRNHLHTLMKNTMLIPLVTITFFFFGWWIYWAFPNGPFIYQGELLWEAAASNARGRPTWPPTSTTASPACSGLRSCCSRGPPPRSCRARSSSASVGRLLDHRGDDRLGDLDHRCRLGLAPEGWMVKLLGYHDAYASGVIHGIAGGTALGVLVVLGPRIGKFRADGTSRESAAAQSLAGDARAVPDLHRLLGLLRGVQRADHLPEGIGGEITGATWTATNIYLAPDDAQRHHLQLPHVAVGRAHGGLCRLARQSVLDLFGRPRRGSSRRRPATTCTTRSRPC